MTMQGKRERRATRRRRDFRVSALEGLESRLTPASTTYTVDLLIDTLSPIEGTLRQAILDSNANPSNDPNQPNRIVFALSSTNVDLNLVAPLPAITAPVVIDGTTVIGYDPTNPSSIITIDGGQLAGDGNNGFTIEAAGGGTTIKGFGIVNFSGDGVLIDGGGGNTIIADNIGTPLGSTPRGNRGNGIEVSNSSNNTIGGTTPTTRNRIESFGSGQSYTQSLAATNSPPNQVATGDFNHDGRPDVVASLQSTPGQSIYAQFQVFLDNPDGTLTPQTPVAIPSGESIQSLTTGALVSGGPDYIIAATRNHVYVYGLGSSQPITTITLNSSSSTEKNIVEIGQFYAGGNPAIDPRYDNNLDIVVAQQKANTLIVYAGDGAGGFSAPITTALPARLLPVSLAVADIDGDGESDVIVGGQNMSIRSLFARGDGTFQIVASSNTLDDVPAQLTTGRFGKNGPLEIVAITPTSPFSGVTLIPIAADGTQSTPSVIDNKSTPLGVATGYFDKSGFLGLVTSGANGSTGTARILLSTADGNFLGANEVFVTSNVSQSIPAGDIATADLTGSGIDDIIYPFKALNFIAILTPNLSSRDGVLITGTNSQGNLVAGNDIGFSSTDSVQSGNGGYGVEITGGASGNTIGGALASQSNLISGNLTGGVLLGNGATQNQVIGNLIGTDAAGRSAVMNSGPGVLIDDASGNTIGGVQAGAGNVISGNFGPGVLIRNDASQNSVLGNLIGLSVDGLGSVANKGDGVQIIDSSNNIIGAVGAGNSIAGNIGNGVSISASSIFAIASDNLVTANGIGISFVNGISTSLGNGGNGIAINGATDTTIGGTNAWSGGQLTIQGGNVVSGNHADGIALSGVPLADAETVVIGNVVGLDVFGSSALGNSGNGISSQDSTGVAIGAADSGSRNIVSGNGGSGIALFGDTSVNLVTGNRIGTNAAGTLSVRNLGDGVLVAQPSPNDSLFPSSNTISGNLISGNAGQGVNIQGSGTTGNQVVSNLIGVDVTGLFGVANVGNGVLVGDASGNTISGNIISDNLLNGVEIDGSPFGNDIDSNTIGLGSDGRKTLPNLLNGVLITQLDSSFAASANNSITGNVISGNIGAGVRIDNQSTANLVAGNTIGLAADGSTPAGNLLAGISIRDASSNTIGGTGSQRNIISANLGNGVEVIGLTTDAHSADGNVVSGNRVGTDGQGRSALGNKSFGILVQDASLAAISGNLVSANILGGIRIADTSTATDPAGDVVVAGNLVGTDVTGQIGLGNGGFGVDIENSHDNTVGGTTPSARNVISANVLSGVLIEGAGAVRNLIAGDWIGLTSDGARPLGNLREGVLIHDGASKNTLGGASVGAGNVISANATHGVELAGYDSTGNLIAGNRIGTAADGSFLSIMGNVLNGIFLNQSNSNVIGQVGAGNLIVNNGLNGVNISASANDVVAFNQIDLNNQNGIAVVGGLSVGSQILNNIIGTDGQGRSGLGNAQQGVLVDASPNTLIRGNTVSANRSSGIYLHGAATTGTLVAGNYIGTDSTGTRPLGNSQDGVTIDGASGNSIGDSSTSSGRNVISSNLANGIQLVNAGTTGNLVVGNDIGVDVTGNAPLGNQLGGVLINYASSNVIGGTSPLATNVISGNGLDGLRIYSSSSLNNLALGNRIGVNAAGDRALPNGRDGVRIESGAGNTIGSPLAFNLISGNVTTGVDIVGIDALGNRVVGNRIGTDVTGTRAIANAQGIVIQSAPNNFVGGVNAGEGNTISGNTFDGVQLIGSGASGNFLAGNRIGTDATGTLSLSNDIGVILNGVSGNVIGGAGAAGNVISGNVSAGVYLLGAAGTAASSNVVSGNYIGTNAAGSAPVTIGSAAALQTIGVRINDGTANVIGGLTQAEGNVISGNTVGITVEGSLSTGNAILSNKIGTDAAGAQRLPNVVGVYLNQVASNVIGAPGAGNLISGNSSVGITVLGLLATGNVIQSNIIGANLSLTRAIPNDTGVYLENAPGNLIGGATTAAGNTIAGNASVAVYIFAAQSVGNVVASNHLGIKTTAKSGIGNGLYGALLYNAPKNTVNKTGRGKNFFFGNKVADIREFTGAVTGTQKTKKSKGK